MIAKSFCLAVTVISVIASTGGCYHNNFDMGRALAPDSVIGFVSVTGTTFEHQLMLRSGDKMIRLSANSSDSIALTNLAGVEILARGEVNGTTMRVTSFTAIGVDGAPVADGILVSNDGKIFLRTSTGMTMLGNPPAQLSEMISARVWIGGPLDTGPNNYGVIVPAVAPRGVHK